MALTHAFFTDIRSTILQELAQAKTSIQVAVAWITDAAIYRLLLEKCAAQVGVSVVMRNDIINLSPAGLDWQAFLRAGGSLYLAADHPALHHKFCLLDGKRLLTGSYNWTYAAQRNLENLVVTDEVAVVSAFRQAFAIVLDQAREVGDITQALSSFPPASDAALLETALVEIAFLQQTGEGEYARLVQEANMAYCQKQYELAEQLLQQALHLEPTGLDAQQLLAGVYWRTQRFALAVTAAAQAEAGGRQDAALWNIRGLAHDGLKQFAQAIACFDRCIQAEPGVSTWYFNKCVALDAWGRERLGDAAALEAIGIASAEIKQYRHGGNDHRLLRAFIERAYLRSHAQQVRADCLAAREVYERLPVAERDQHDLDDIVGKLGAGG